jgi:hypothetical protein
MTTDKPTDAMIEAGAAVAHERGCYAVTRPDLTAIYTAMHEARPQSAAPSPDADLVERVARAIYASMHDDAPEWDRVKIIRAENGFKGDHSILQRDCLKAATAAIEALTATAPPSDAALVESAERIEEELRYYRRQGVNPDNVLVSVKGSDLRRLLARYHFPNADWNALRALAAPPSDSDAKGGGA